VTGKQKRDMMKADFRSPIFEIISKTNIQLLQDDITYITIRQLNRFSINNQITARDPVPTICVSKLIFTDKLSKLSNGLNRLIY
jgi:hypothetical protein